MESILATRTGRDALRAVVLESLPLDPTRRIEWQVWVAFWGRAGTNPALSAEQHRRYAQWRGLLDQLVADAEPALDATRVGTASTLLAAGIDGLGLQATLEPRRFPRRTIEHLADASLDAVLPS
jgi:hypothetical protein